MNIGANSIPFGADMTGLVPHYLTIRRGQIICALLSVCFVPWELIATAQKFITFLGSYNIFMAPLCGVSLTALPTSPLVYVLMSSNLITQVIMVDYFLIRKGNIHVPSLYNGTPGSLYWYKSGTNLAGVFAWCVGVSLGLPGLVGAYEPSMVNQSAKNMYKIGWILYAFASAVVYYVLMQFVVKPETYPEGRHDEPISFEHLAHTQREGFFDDEWPNIAFINGTETREEESLPSFIKA